MQFDFFIRPVIVTEKTIRTCFRHAGIIQEEVSTEIECTVATMEEGDDLPLNGYGELTVLILLHAIWMYFLVLMMTFLPLKL